MGRSTSYIRSVLFVWCYMCNVFPAVIKYSQIYFACFLYVAWSVKIFLHIGSQTLQRTKDVEEIISRHGVKTHKRFAHFSIKERRSWFQSSLCNIRSRCKILLNQKEQWFELYTNETRTSKRKTECKTRDHYLPIFFDIFQDFQPTLLSVEGLKVGFKKVQRNY